MTLDPVDFKTLMGESPAAYRERQKRADRLEAKYNREHPESLSPWTGEAKARGKEWRTAMWRTCGFAGWNEERSKALWNPEGCLQTTWTHFYLKLCDDCYSRRKRELWRENKRRQRAGDSHRRLRVLSTEPLPEPLPPCPLCKSTKVERYLKIVNFRREPHGLCQNCGYRDDLLAWWKARASELSYALVVKESVPVALQKVELLHAQEEMMRLQAQNRKHQFDHRVRNRPPERKIHHARKGIEALDHAMEELSRVLFHHQALINAGQPSPVDPKMIAGLKEQLLYHKRSFDSEIVRLGSKIAKT